MAAHAEPKYELIIDGHEVPATRGEHRPVLDPATNQPIAEAAVASRDAAVLTLAATRPREAISGVSARAAK